MSYADECAGKSDGTPCVDNGNSEGCYPYGDGCEIRHYACDGGKCKYSSSDRNTDTNVGSEYCKDNKLYVQRRDYGCFGVSCSYTTSEVLVSSCDDGKEWTDDSCVDGKCVNELMKSPYEFTSSLHQICTGASFAVAIRKSKGFVPDNTLFDFYLGSTKVRSACPLRGDPLWADQCGIENIQVPPGTYKLRASYRVFNHEYWEVIDDNFAVVPECATDIQCSFGFTMLTETVAYNPSFDGEVVIDNTSYVVCPSTRMRAQDISTYNYMCADGCIHSRIPTLIGWTYDGEGKKRALTDNGVHIASDLDRRGVIGPTSSVEGTRITGFTGSSVRTSYQSSMDI